MPPNISYLLDISSGLINRKLTNLMEFIVIGSFIIALIRITMVVDINLVIGLNIAAIDIVIGVIAVTMVIKIAVIDIIVEVIDIIIEAANIIVVVILFVFVVVFTCKFQMCVMNCI